MPHDEPAPETTFTRAGVVEGVRMMIPLLPGYVVYAAAFGAAAAAKGLTLGQTVGMSGIVYAGAAQMVALELWRDTWQALSLLTVALVTATVNARFILMGASLQPWIRHAPTSRNAVNLFFLTDANYLLSSRYHAEGGRNIGVMFGAGIVTWLVWVGATLPGYLGGALVAEPKRLALDLVLPIFFAVLAVPLWRGRATAIPWGAAALVAVAVDRLVPGYAFIAAGAITGALTAALLPARYAA